MATFEIISHISQKAGLKMRLLCIDDLDISKALIYRYGDWGGLAPFADECVRYEKTACPWRIMRNHRPLTMNSRYSEKCRAVTRSLRNVSFDLVAYRFKNKSAKSTTLKPLGLGATAA